MNAYNSVTLIGRIPVSEKIRYEYHEATNDKGTNARLNGSISVMRTRKPEGEQYFPEDLFNFTAWGPSANYMSEYIHRGDYVAIQGELEVNVVEDKRYYGIKVDSVRRLPGTSNSGGDDTDGDDSEEAPAPKAKSNPFKSKSNPFAKKQ